MPEKGGEKGAHHEKTKEKGGSFVFSLGLQYLCTVKGGGHADAQIKGGGHSSRLLTINCIY